jgi:hypothetical protein
MWANILGALIIGGIVIDPFSSQPFVKHGWPYYFFLLVDVALYFGLAVYFYILAKRQSQISGK